MKRTNDGQELISILHVSKGADVPSLIQRGLKLIECPRFESDSAIVIKPNLCCISGSETGATTDLRVVEGIVSYLQKEFKVSDITLVESDGTQVLADMAFKLLGYETLSKKLGVKLVNLSKVPFSTKVFDDNTFLKKIRVPHILEDADYIISVPKIKTHTLCTFSGTLKNQYGCNPYPKKWLLHKRLHEAIVDLNVAFKADLIVVDGITAMEGRGPTEGIPVRLDTLIFGRDAVAVDHLIAELMGIEPNSVKYLVEAQARQIGTSNYKTVGVSPAKVKRRFRAKPKWDNLYGLGSSHDF